jgi:hypothetical protein
MGIFMIFWGFMDFLGIYGDFYDFLGDLWGFS